MIAGTLKQFLSSDRVINPATRQFPKDFSTGDTKTPQSKDDLFRVLLEVIDDSTVFLIADAPDECSNREELEDLISQYWGLLPTESLVRWVVKIIMKQTSI